MIPEAVREWLEEQDAPFTIFVTPSKDIALYMEKALGKLTETGNQKCRIYLISRYYI